MFDILIRQFLSIQEVQQTTLENVPLGDFHRKAFTEVVSRLVFLAVDNFLLSCPCTAGRGIQEKKKKSPHVLWQKQGSCMAN